MRKINTLLLTVVVLIYVGISACGKDDDTTPIADNPTPTDTTNQDTTVTKTRTEMLSKKWIVDQAFVGNGVPDNSSKGLTLDVRSNGTYTLSTGYIGTWEFEANETKINWDKGTQFNQVFTLNEFTDSKIDASFVSAFTGQNARWIMIPF